MAKKTANKKTKYGARTSKSHVVYLDSRTISSAIRILLFTKAGGRCEFNGCRAPVLRHHLTFKEGVFADVAHIVAFSEDGPRGKDGPRPTDINSVANLMLLCPGCHKLIDDNEDRYPRSVLENYKLDHEAKVEQLLSLLPNSRTSVAQFLAPIRGSRVGVTNEQVIAAVAPRYPLNPTYTVMDLNVHQSLGDGPQLLDVSKRLIEQFVHEVFRERGDAAITHHVSLFAIGPIPLLVFLGSKLTNKVDLDLFQRHRDPESWTWKTDGDIAEYKIEVLQTGSADAPIAIKMSLSGPHRPETIPEPYRSDATIYHLTYANRDPSGTALRRREDLDKLRGVYQFLLARIHAEHPAVRAVSLFPAIPAPVAVLVGRDLLPKTHPEIRVYDLDEEIKVYRYVLSANM